MHNWLCCLAKVRKHVSHKAVLPKLLSHGLLDYNLGVEARVSGSAQFRDAAQQMGVLLYTSHPCNVELEKFLPWGCCLFREQLLPQNQASLQAGAAIIQHGISSWDTSAV